MTPSDIARCFHGIIPSIIASCDRHGMPNVTYLSHVQLIDDRHVALSRQFFNKTSRNIEENPQACIEVCDPVTFQAYRLRLRFLRTETSGALFDSMALRIQAIASHTGMAGVFRLIGADVFEVLRVEKVDGFLAGAAPPEEVAPTGFRTELRGLQLVSERINRAEDLETLLAAALDALAVYFGFEHTIVLLNDETAGRLVTISCRGYGGGVGAEVAFGEGLIGTVAAEKRVLRISGLHASLQYGRAVRREVLSGEGGRTLRPEIPLPGLADAQSALVIPLTIGDRLTGVLATESRDPLAFGEWDEAYLGIIGNQIALGIDRVLQEPDGGWQTADGAGEKPPSAIRHTPAVKRHTLIYYRDDDSIFFDGEYLIRNVPGRILWKLLAEWKRQGRTAFTNRELRLDRSLGLPDLKDNLETRLILLRSRLREKLPAVQLAPTGRGRFALVVDAELELVER